MSESSILYAAKFIHQDKHVGMLPLYFKEFAVVNSYGAGVAFDFGFFASNFQYAVRLKKIQLLDRALGLKRLNPGELVFLANMEKMEKSFKGLLDFVISKYSELIDLYNVDLVSYNSDGSIKSHSKLAFDSKGKVLDEFEIITVP